MNILKLPVNASIQCVLDTHCQKFFSLLRIGGHELDMKWLPAARCLLSRCTVSQDSRKEPAARITNLKKGPFDISLIGLS